MSSTIAAIKAVLLDKEKKPKLEQKTKDVKSKPKKQISTSSLSKTLPATVTSSSSKSSTAQSLAEAITNARKSVSSKTAPGTVSPTPTPVKKKEVDVIELDSPVAFSVNQGMRMAKEFEKKNFLTKEENRALAIEVGLSEDEVKKWFANRRKKKARSSNIFKEERPGKGAKQQHGLRSLEVSALQPMEDILSLTKVKPPPEVVDILDDSSESENKDSSLLELSDSVVKAQKTVEVKSSVPSSLPNISKEKAAAVSIPKILKGNNVINSPIRSDIFVENDIQKPISTPKIKTLSKPINPKNKATAGITPKATKNIAVNIPGNKDAIITKTNVKPDNKPKSEKDTEVVKDNGAEGKVTQTVNTPKSNNSLEKVIKNKPVKKVSSAENSSIKIANNPKTIGSKGKLVEKAKNIVSEDVKTVATPKIKKEKMVTPKSTKAKSKVESEAGLLKSVLNENAKSKQYPKKDKSSKLEPKMPVIQKPDPKNVKPCTREEDLVEELLRRIEELEEELKDKEGDIYYTKKDLDAVQATLEGKERVLSTVQESIPKVVSEHKRALEAKDTEISDLKLITVQLQREIENNKPDMIIDTEEEKAAKLSSSSVLEIDREVVQKDQKDVAADIFLTQSLLEKENEMRLLKETNDNLTEDLKNSSKLHSDEVKEHQKIVTSLKEQLKEKDDEIAVYKYKEKLALDSQSKLEDAQKMLDMNRKETLELKDFERKLTRKITELEFNLFTKTAESDTQALIISKLNEKIQSLQQKMEEADPEEIDKEAIDLYSQVLDDGLRKHNDNQSPLESRPHSLEVKTDASKNTILEGTDMVETTEKNFQVPGNVEVIAVPSKRTLPFASSDSPDHKKLKVSGNIMVYNNQDLVSFKEWIEDLIIGLVL